jgi:hypothetical protein
MPVCIVKKKYVSVKLYFVYLIERKKKHYSSILPNDQSKIGLCNSWIVRSSIRYLTSELGLWTKWTELELKIKFVK